MKTRKKTNFKKKYKNNRKYNKFSKKNNRKYNKFSKKNNRKYNKFSKKNNRKIEGGGLGSVFRSRVTNKPKTAAKKDAVNDQDDAPQYDPKAANPREVVHSPHALQIQSLGLRAASKEVGQGSGTPILTTQSRFGDYEIEL